MTRTRKETIRSVCPALAGERARLMATLDAFRDEEMDFRPDAPESAHPLSVREILMHIIDADHRLVDGGVRGVSFTNPEFVCDESFSRIAEVTVDQLDRAGIRAALEQSWRGVDAILDWPVEALQRKVTPESATSLFTLLSFAFMHISQHRGQLWTYLELLGRRPPRDD